MLCARTRREERTRSSKESQEEDFAARLNIDEAGGVRPKVAVAVLVTNPGKEGHLRLARNAGPELRDSELPPAIEQ